MTDRWDREYDELDRLYAAGKIDDDELARRGAEVVSRQELACPHTNTYVDGDAYGCDDCGAKLRRNDGGGAVVVKSGCAVVAAALLGAAVAATYGVIEAVRHLA